MERDKSFDILSGIYIIFMIMGAHIAFLSGNFSNLGMGKVFFLFTPYLAFFFFKSGYYYKANADSSLKFQLRSILISKLPVLVVFAFWGVLTDLIINYRQGIRHILHVCKGIVMYLSMPSNGSLWFFTTLILVLLLSRILDKIKIPLIFIWIILLFAGCFFCERKLMIWGVNNIPICMFFFISGRISKDYMHLIPPNISVLLLSASLIVNYFQTSYVDLFTANLVQGRYFLFIIISLAIIVMSKLAIVYLFNIEIPLLSYIGKNSLVFYALHMPLVLLSLHFFPSIKGNPYLAICLFVIVILLCTIYNEAGKRFPLLLGKFS